MGGAISSSSSSVFSNRRRIVVGGRVEVGIALVRYGGGNDNRRHRARTGMEARERDRRGMNGMNQVNER